MERKGMGGQMKKLGKLTALWLCWELWDWLAKNPDKKKSDWPEWEENGGKYNAFDNCFACEFDNQNDNFCYRNCIVPCFKENLTCTASGSPFVAWCISKTSKTLKKQARIIANSTYKEYVRLGGKRSK